MKTIIYKALEKEINKKKRAYGHPLPYFSSQFLSELAQIKLEYNNYIAKHSGNLSPIDDISEEQKDLNKDKKWKALFIYGYGHYNVKIKKNFNTLSKLIDKYESQITLVMFSKMEAGKVIPSHKGNNIGVLRIQVGIDIAEPELCQLKVEDNVFHLKENELLIFDDTFEHSAKNESTSDRTVLIIDFKKKLPFPYNILNNYYLKSIQNSPYIRNVLKKL